MNTQIQEAANKWWMLKSTMEAAEIAFRIFPKENEWEGTIEQIVSIWIQEVVMEWWFDKRYVISSLTTDEELATIYLKEQESKEVSNVSVSVEEAAKKEASFGDDGDGYSVLNYKGFISGANWQKKQDKAIISELLDVVNMFYATMTAKDYTEEAFTKVESVINNANNYINQQ